MLTLSVTSGRSLNAESNFLCFSFEVFKRISTIESQYLFSILLGSSICELNWQRRITRGGKCHNIWTCDVYGRTWREQLSQEQNRGFHDEHTGVGEFWKWVFRRSEVRGVLCLIISGLLWVFLLVEWWSECVCVCVHDCIKIPWREDLQQPYS